MKNEDQVATKASITTAVLMGMFGAVIFMALAYGISALTTPIEKGIVPCQQIQTK